ncbi:DNA-mis-repair domain-containing protein [Fusarium sp. LHS14.1]|nr:DNA-mis-repair domain-containing protein [Fusarium sp. LHS14.1]
MSILALPPSTARLLGSSSAIADPLSLVKELVDNSIDAGATCIEITTTSNTIDKIQVRDNGRGIRLEDYDSLGRRAHTSKLRTFDELESKGGTTLGFRGEALASANSLATIKVSTRTAQDPVGSLLFLKFGQGGVEKQQPISSTVGTTVQAWKLFDNIPVRKQTALKGSRKTLTNIKKLLEGYALALPHLKLSFKVPGDPCQPWLYSPCSSMNTREAITQIFGHALVTQLDEISSGTGTNRSATRLSQEIVLTAFLPSRGSDAKIVKNKGAFISVDSRPISSTTGTGKKIVAIFKASISRTLASTKDLRSLPNPFIQVSIKCQPGSYDPNVSPLKDEVLFKDEPAILNCFQALCDKVYGGKDPGTTGMTSGREEQRNVRITRQMQRETSLLQTSVTPLGSGEKPNGVNCQGNTQGSSTMNGPDPIEALNDELERVLGFSSNNSQGGNAPSPVAGSGSRSLSTARPAYRNEAADTEEPRTVSATMRTKAVVNLSRNDSNSSDPSGAEGLIPVQLARRHAASSRRQESPPIRFSEDIGRYFRPKRHEPIEIATDETATVENMQEEHLSNPNTATGRLEIRRPPLMELTESDLNMPREEEEEDYEEEGDDGSVIELPVAEQNATPLRNMAGQAIAPGHAVPSPLINIPFRPLTRPRPAPNPTLRSEEPSALRTPPSSDPARANHLYRGSPSGSPINQGLARGRMSPRNAARMSTDRFADHGRRRSVLDNGQTGSLGRRQVQHGRHGSQLTGRRNTLTLGHDDADAHPKDVLHGSHAHAEDQEG